MAVRLGTLLKGPLSAVRGAVDTLKYAQAFVTHEPSDTARLRADDNERELILAEELSDLEVQPEPPLRLA